MSTSRETSRAKVIELTDLPKHGQQTQAEEALRSNEESFRLIVETIPGLIAVMTPQGEVEHVNRGVLDYFGRTLEELKKWGTTDAVHPVDLPRVIAAWQHAIETGLPYEFEHRIRRADGEYRWFQLRGLPLRDADGHIVRWYVLLTDIDARKQSEEKLRRSEADLLEAERLSHTGSWRHDLLSGTLTVSPEVLRMYGLQSDDCLLTIEALYDGIHPDDRSMVRQAYESAHAQKADFVADYRIVLRDGTITYLHTVGHPVLNESGEVVEYVGFGMDVTPQRQATARLEEAFEEIQRLKDRLQDENVALREEIDQASMFEEIVGASAALKSVLSQISQVAPTDSTVLISGETGTGKELVARAIHKRSLRAERAFISLNCAATPPSLIASELFGHEKGAFTGAVQQRRGRFELAHSGTIFLDEVGEIPMDTQIALLRVLQERQVERVGGIRAIQVDVRVIAATNRDLSTAIADGSFRSDLFYRLNVFPILVPPLRKRREDIPVLIEYFVKRFAEKMAKPIRRIEKRTLEVCQKYSWPGNIRELQNIVERSVILCTSDTFSIDETWLSSQSLFPPKGETSLPQTLEDEEKEMIENALAKSRGRVAGPRGAAAKLGIPASTLESKIKQMGIDKGRFAAAS